MTKLLRISTYIFISIIIGAIIITGLSFPFGIELGITLKVIVMIIGTLAFGLLAVTWIQYMEKYYDSIIPEDRILSLEDIEYSIRKEGYIPFMQDDRLLTFKADGVEFRAFYEDDKFILITTYLVDDNDDVDLLLKSCSLAQGKVILFRSYLHECCSGQTGISFEIVQFVHSVNELERFFPELLNVLLYSIKTQREIYVSLCESDPLSTF